MSFITPADYRHAFGNYLRRGVPIDLSLKAARDRPTTRYIWRTRGDGKVRPSHAANDGRIFAWDDPPPTGHPGEDYNCRCTAEPISITPQEIYQLCKRKFNEVWSSWEMSVHFRCGEGRTVTLEEIGHLELVRDYYTRHYYPRFVAQLRRKAARQGLGPFTDWFDTAYDFGGVRFAHGHSRVRGVFEGEIVELSDGQRYLVGTGRFQFSDIFKDPLRIAEYWVKIWSNLPRYENLQEEDLYWWFRKATDLLQKPFKITGEWEIDHTILL